MPIHNVVYFPIEVRNRELSARLIQAIHLLQNNTSVVIGVGEELSRRLPDLPSGIFLLKGLNGVQVETLSALRAAGHVAVAIDEEALGIADIDYMMRDVSADAARLVSMVYCQGERQRQGLRLMRGVPDAQLLVTGNPRVDLLRPPLREIHFQKAEEIRAENGRFVLINTNSGSIHNLWGDLDTYRKILVGIGWMDPANPDDQALLDDHIAHDTNNISAVHDFVATMATNRPDIRLVLRPHPSERPEAWDALVGGYPNITRVERSELGPWIVASDLVVVTGCTTAVEAALLGKDALSIVQQPPEVRHPGFFLANQVALQSRSADAAARIVVNYFDGDRAPFARSDAERKARLCEHILDVGSRFASNRIGDHMIGLLRARGATSFPTDFSMRGPIEIAKISWTKAYVDANELSHQISVLAERLEQPIQGSISQIGHGTFLLTPTGPNTNP